MNDELRKTVRIQRDAKVGTDSRGRTVWTKPIADVELDLVSTVMLKKILKSDDAGKKQDLLDAVKGNDGVLAHDSGSNRFEIITDDELENALATASDESSFNRPADIVLEPITSSNDEQEFSLVTTQALRKILGSDDQEAAAESDKPDAYNPYDSS